MKRDSDLVRNRGFTIVELMVTLVITSILILGSITFLTSANKSNQVQSAISGLNVSGRFGLEQLSRDIRMAGYRDSSWTIGPLGDAIAAVNGAAGGSGDSITLTYEGSRDCNYGLAVAGTVSNTYRIVDGNLECNGEPLTGGAEELQIYLGEDTDSNRVANRWLSPGTVGLDMTRIVSVRVHLLVRTKGNDISSGSQDYYFDYADHAAANDGQIRREYSVTVALRNQI